MNIYLVNLSLMIATNSRVRKGEGGAGGGEGGVGKDLRRGGGQC